MTNTQAVKNQSIWDDLHNHAKDITSKKLIDLFQSNEDRFDKFSFASAPLFVDFSKNHITSKTLDLLITLANACNLKQMRDDLFDGKDMNTSEKRAVLHSALRLPEPPREVADTLKAMSDFSKGVRNGAWTGHSGHKITDIVSIGIGGSTLGPQLAVEGLTAFHHDTIKCHFISNVEGSDTELTLNKLSPDTTLFIIASKSFTTVETMQNAHICRDWILNHFANNEKAIARHFVAASTNINAVKEFGIAPDNMFPFKEWVGGRFSVWSSIGLPLMIMIGSKGFHEFLSGAHLADTHFKNEPLQSNIPVLMGLIGIWYRNILAYPTMAVIPYHSLLKRLPAYLQQIDMESNGKSMTRDGKPVSFKTGPIIFGEPGTDAQHSFFQWLHQGTDIVPVDIVATVKTSFGSDKQQNMLLANALAQSEALMTGQQNPSAPHKHFDGNRPSTTFLLDELTPKSLGMLMATYEHKVFVQGVIWDINSFDQFGVELGKVLATKIGDELNAQKIGDHDGSTTGLMKYIRRK